MSGLADRLRREVDAVAPVTLHEVRAAAPQRRARRAAGLRLAIGATLLPAALVAVILLATHLDRSRPQTVGTGAPTAPVTVWITVPRAAVSPGDAVQATVHVQNTTGAPVTVGDTCPGGWPRLGLVGPAGTFQVSSTSNRCNRTMTLRKGDSAFEVSVSTWSICTGEGSRTGSTLPPCAGGPGPIPVGRYQLRMFDARLPLGSRLPPPVQVTVQPQTIDQFRDFAAIPTGYGALFGSFGPGIPGGSATAPDLTLVFTKGSLQVTAQAIAGKYEVFLPVGTWEVKSTDGTVCARGITVAGEGAENESLVWPLAGCQDLGGPPASTPPSANQP